MSSITTKDGASVFYKDWGTGPTVVFSHGWPLNADAWDPQMLFLGQKGYRVVAHDRRGHGRSYTKLGFRVDDDIVNSDDFRVVQLTPPGSAASVSFGTILVAAEQAGWPGESKMTFYQKWVASILGVPGSPSMIWVLRTTSMFFLSPAAFARR